MSQNGSERFGRYLDWIELLFQMNGQILSLEVAKNWLRSHIELGWAKACSRPFEGTNETLQVESA
jgi:hypothetical protein